MGSGVAGEGAGGKPVALHRKRLLTHQCACTGISGDPYTCNEWLNFDSEFR